MALTLESPDSRIYVTHISNIHNIPPREQEGKKLILPRTNRYIIFQQKYGEGFKQPPLGDSMKYSGASRFSRAKASPTKLSTIQSKSSKIYARNSPFALISPNFFKGLYSVLQRGALTCPFPMVRFHTILYIIYPSQFLPQYFD